MAAAYGIVRNHDGWISLYSESGHGTVVRIYLPAIEDREKEVKEQKIEPVKGQGTILVIEDEETVMDVSRTMLERLGYRILEANTGKKAIEIAKSFDGVIDLAILDIVLPDMHGMKIYPLLMEAGPNLKVLVCSGYSIDGPAKDILDAGAQGFLQKPFSLAALSEKLKEVLEDQ
jgi:CheY-like chemotaxis protein